VEIYDWLGFLYWKEKDLKRSDLCYQYYEELSANLIKFDLTLQDEYLLRLAKIKFMQKNYNRCYQILVNLSIDLKKQDIDDFLRFEYNQIQAELQLWIGVMAMKNLYYRHCT
jgi:hypothetical protein